MRVAYYECGGAVDLPHGGSAPPKCPHAACNAQLKEVRTLDTGERQ